MIQVGLDTNIIIASFSSYSKYHWVIRKLIDGYYTICVSNDILFEYEEKISEKYSIRASQNFISFLKEAPNCKLVEIYYQWNLISDPDDNKFADCAFSSSATYIVTEDRHFNILKSINFPYINVIGLNDFEKILGIE